MKSGDLFLCNAFFGPTRLGIILDISYYEGSCSVLWITDFGMTKSRIARKLLRPIK